MIIERVAVVVRCDAIEDIRLVVRLQVEDVSFTISELVGTGK